MRSLIGGLALVLSMSAFAQETQVTAPPRPAGVGSAVPSTGASQAPSSKAELAQDFAMVCGLSKVAHDLGESPEFKNDKLALGVRVSAMLTAALRTPEAKTTRRSLSAVSSTNRAPLWRQAAKDVGLPDWKCSTLESL